MRKNKLLQSASTQIHPEPITEASLIDIPNDALDIIFSFLNKNERQNLALTNRQLHNLYNELKTQKKVMAIPKKPEWLKNQLTHNLTIHLQKQLTFRKENSYKTIRKYLDYHLELRSSPLLFNIINNTTTNPEIKLDKNQLLININELLPKYINNLSTNLPSLKLHSRKMAFRHYDYITNRAFQAKYSYKINNYQEIKRLKLTAGILLFMSPTFITLSTLPALIFSTFIYLAIISQSSVLQAALTCAFFIAFLTSATLLIFSTAIAIYSAAGLIKNKYLTLTEILPTRKKDYERYVLETTKLAIEGINKTVEEALMDAAHNNKGSTTNPSHKNTNTMQRSEISKSLRCVFFNKGAIKRTLTQRNWGDSEELNKKLMPYAINEQSRDTIL